MPMQCKLAEAINEQSYQKPVYPLHMLNRVRVRAGLPELTTTDLPDQGYPLGMHTQERRVELPLKITAGSYLVRTGKH